MLGLMTTPDAPIRLGDFVFEPATGLVRSLVDPEHSVRLPPKPASLLQMLIDADGQIVGRDEIREALWPDVTVDYDQNLRFVVRQVRAAFGDSAGAPRYVGTVPKRGYQLLIDREELPPDGAAPESRSAQSSSSAHSRVAVLATAVVLVVMLVGLWWRGNKRGVVDLPIRLAVVPFQLAAEGPRGDELERLGEWLLAELVEGRTDVLEVIGPRTTVAYSSFPFPDLRAMEAELDVDYVLNARPFEDEDGARELIVELIRLSDGAHPVARFYEDERSWREIGDDVLAGVLEALDLPVSSE